MSDEQALLDKLNQLAAQAKWDELHCLIATTDIASCTRKSGRSALIELARYGHVPLVRELLERKADVNSVDDRGLTPLLSLLEGAASGRQTMAAMLLLLDSGADPNRRAYLGQSALHYALRKLLLDHARVLLENGADPTLKTDDIVPEDGFDIAQRTKSAQIIDLLASYRRSRND